MLPLKSRAAQFHEPASQRNGHRCEKQRKERIAVRSCHGADVFAEACERFPCWIEFGMTKNLLGRYKPRSRPQSGGNRPDALGGFLRMALENAAQGPRSSASGILIGQVDELKKVRNLRRRGRFPDERQCILDPSIAFVSQQILGPAA